MNNDRGNWTSASSADADTACPGRHRAQIGLQDSKSDDAEHGNLVHAALATSDDSKLSLEQRETVSACRQIESKVVSQFFGSGIEPWCVRNPDRMWVSFDELRHSGRVDAVYRHELRALIVDYKSLFSDIPASSKNKQLRDYAVLVRDNLLVDEIGVTLIQPRVSHSPEICLYDKGDLLKAKGQLCERVNASNAMNAKRVPSDLACKFCLAAKLGKCVEYQQWAGQIAPPAIMAALDVPIAQWSPETRSRAMDAVKQGRKLMDIIEDAVRLGLTTDPAFCPGWELAPGRNLESVNEPQTVYERFIALGGKHQAFMGCIDVRKQHLRAELSNTLGFSGKGLNDAFKQLLNGCTDSSTTKPILKRKDKE